ncbi:MAG: 16S rRNA (adenine(1518)-N(6)/adenine(1519)-N(6))-dimethyltransferase RsmA [Thermodesulfovibrionales bacterium]
MRPKKHLGQNFLYDPSILRRIVQAAEISSEDTVVEIGPGHGRLTCLLAEKAKRVIAIELDRELYEKLRQDEVEKDIELVHGNALRYPYEDLPEFKVVANIPYYITTPIIFRLIESRGNLISMTLTVQREVAKRIVAQPGTKDYGVLSIMIQYYTVPELKFIIPKGAFRPVPKVDSALIHMKIRKSPPVEVKDEKFFFRIVKTAFSQRRKTLANALKPIIKEKSPHPPFTKGGQGGIREILIHAGIDPQRRPGTLSIEEFARLADVLYKL